MGPAVSVFNPPPPPAPVADAADDPIIVKTEYKLRQIRKRDILYIEGLKDYVKFYVEDEPRAIISLLSLKNLERILGDGMFMRVHRSYIVNLTKIKTIEKGTIIIANQSIPVSESYRPQLNDYIASHTAE